MSCFTSKQTAFVWLSGFFATPTLMHLIRVVLRAPVRLGTWDVPLSTSYIVLVITGLLSFIFCRMACRCEEKKK